MRKQISRPRCRGLLFSFLVPMLLAPAAALASGSFHLQEATIDDIQRAILSRELKTEQLVRLYLARIKAYNGTCVKEPQGILGRIETIANAGQLNALSTLNLRPANRKALGFDDRKARSMTDAADDNANMPDALEVAAAQDREFARIRKLVGPLHGVVLSIKDQYDTFDMRTTSGADAHYANDRPPRDANFIQRLRAAGAIILAKSNLAEYASNGARSSFGGTFCNPYDTERVPGMSSAGSATSVAANLVTCAIAEETGPSIRWPAAANNTVGLSPTQELVSRHGLIGAGLNTRTGPICRTVGDAARVFDAYAGYDPEDPLTVFSIGRKPPKPYADYADEKRLTGLRIGVVREYMDKKLFTAADAETIDVIERELGELRKLGATIVDPGAGGALLTSCLRKYGPGSDNMLFTSRYPEKFPRDGQGKPSGDHIATLVDMAMDPSLVPDGVTLRDLERTQAVGEGKYMMNVYLRQRGDSEIRSNADLIAKATFYDDPRFPDRRKARETAEQAKELNLAERVMRRFSLQQMLLQCMQEQNLDALTYPMTNIPPGKIDAPQEPTVNGRSPLGWTLMGSQGFPAITVPAGFTTHVYDRVRDPAAPLPPAASGGGGGGGGGGVPPERTRLVGPIAAKLPVSIDFVGRPFDEATLFRIASAYAAATKHRTPPAGFGPIAGEP